MLRGSHKSFYHSQKKKILHSAKTLYQKSNTSKILSILGIAFVAGIFLLWAFFLRGIPSLEGLENGNYFRESTVIYDAEGKEIYSLFKDGKRTYVPYDAISQPIKDAIISIEDQSFFENPGIDFLGLIRVAATHLTGGKFGRAGGASTISQQLIKNTLLTNEVSIKRKVQEAYLSYKMNTAYTKEKILEMYLNAIPFGYNANGIEQASRTFFGKSAKDVGPLGAVILASLPNGPTKFSPYLHRDRLMGKVEVYPKSDPSLKKELRTAEDRKKYLPLYEDFKQYLNALTLEKNGNEITICNVDKQYMKEALFRVSSDGCTVVATKDITQFFANITLPKSIATEDGNEDYIIEYTIGRKDLVASRMLEDGKIDEKTFQKILYDGLEFEFKKYAESIRYPHFVMYIKEYLETKYGKDIDITSGLKVYTTINPKFQDKAEELVKKQVPINKTKGASSAALVSMDNTTGKLLAMVGGADYFDTENEGNNNMATALRQPGSSFKPFVYALAMSKNPIGPESPVADVDTKFGSWNPDNYDGGFKGVMMVKNALAYSRNIPAIKMYFLAGQEEEIAKTWKEGGMKTLDENGGFGGSMALGAAEVRPVDLMQAYSVLANNGIKRDFYAIERIEDNEGNILEERKKPSKEETPIFSPAASYLVTKILSDNNARPESSFWRNALSVSGRVVAAKTGTADMKTKNGKKLPRDLWTAGYTPQITTVVWAGNIDGSATKGTCDGLNCAASIWKGYMEFVLKDFPKEDFKKPKDVYTYNIVKSSGKLATKNTPESQIIQTMMAVKFDEYDDGQKEVQVDTLCNGPVSDNTPPDAIATLYIPSSKPVIDGYDPEWTAGFFAAIRKGTGSGETLESSPTISDTPCERPSSQGSVNLTLENVGIGSDNTTTTKKTIELKFSGDRPIKTIRIRYDGTVIKEVDYGTGAKKSGSERIAVDMAPGENTVIAEAVDIYGFQYNASTQVLVGGESAPTNTQQSAGQGPSISLINPKGGSIRLYQGDAFNLRFRVNVSTSNREIDVNLDGKTLQSAVSGDTFVFPIDSEGVSVGAHTLQIILTDGNFKTATESIKIDILKR